MTITSKSTKAEIWEAYQALLTQHEAQVITLPAARNTATIVIREARDLGQDLYRLGSLLRQWISAIVTTYNRPILRAR
jgi:uncharacterized membrane-anchored protein